MSFDREKAQKIWQTASLVPQGKISSYGFIADLAGLPGRARMVGKVMQFAPQQMRVPWHRILKSNGQIAFAAGTESARRQTELLRLDGVEVINNRVSLKRYRWQPELGELLEMDF
jgi:methylated-DNA-protein-cysteine methyltransferase-like protein